MDLSFLHLIFGVQVTGVTTSTNVSVTTNVSVGSSVTAASFHGDGSKLTGIPPGFSSARAYTFNQLFS